MPVNPLGPATRLLAALRAEFGSKAPDAVYLAPGPLAAWDCEHLAVSVVGLLPGTSDGTGRAGGHPSRHAGAIQIPRVVLEARILRCYPTIDDNGTTPTPAAIQAASAVLMADVGLLLAGVYRFLTDSPPGVATAGQVDPLGPEGALAGYRTQLTVSPVE